MQIRPYQPKDWAATYRVCLETGDSGLDATHLHTDPNALGNIYVGAYLRFEPELAYVLEDENGVCGYVLGALDSKVFYQRYLQEWLPPLQQTYARPTGDRGRWNPSAQLHALLFEPDMVYKPELAKWPAHLHIDLIARAQGKGWGKQMIDVLLAELVARKSSGVHLGVSARNDRAIGFYQKMGFAEIMRDGPADDGTIYMARRLP